jgi:LysM repeat protein
MKKIRPILVGMIGFSFILVLMTGCYKPAAPDVVPTVVAGATLAATVQAGEEMPDVMATAAANATLAVTPTPTESTPAATEPTPTPTLAASPTPEPATEVPTEPTPTATSPPATGGTHVVQQGENLFRIALRYGTTVEAISAANGIANPSLIKTGQTLTIPASDQTSAPSTGATTYVVQAGDNLFRIALRYNMSHVYLAQYNNIVNPSTIHVGQVLNIPPH